MENTHLVIQGPILSWSPKSSLDRQFSSTEVVNTHIARAAPTFKTVHIVTWQGQPVDGIRDFIAAGNFANVHLHQVPDPGRGADWKGPMADNRLRQYCSTLTGLDKALETASPGDLAIKIRTDQSIDLDLLGRETRSALARDIDAIVFPFVNPYDMYSVGDFYMGGTLGRMVGYFRFLIDNLAMPVGSRSVHVDLAQKYMLFSGAASSPGDFRFALTGKAARRKGSVPLERREIDIWAAYIADVFKFYSRDSLNSVTWRGDDLGSRRAFLFAPDTDDPVHCAKAITSCMTCRTVDRSIMSRTVFGPFVSSRLTPALQKYAFPVEFSLKHALARL
jgi:hypothetical protein